MNKKLLAVLLSFSIACTPLIAFAEGESETENDTETVTEAVTETVADTETGAEAEFEELTVIDDMDCIVKITSIEPSEEYGYELEAYFENNSDLDYYFLISNASLNGVMCDPFFGIDVAAGKKANSEILFYSFADITEDIGDITEIEFSFSVYDNDTWDDITEGTACIYPQGEDQAVQFERETTDTDIVLLDNEYATFIVTGYGYDETDYTLNLFLVNKTDERVTFVSQDVSVNGFMIDPYWGADLTAGKSMYSTMTWYEEDLEENDLEEVTDVEFSLVLYDHETWEAYFDETVTFEP